MFCCNFSDKVLEHFMTPRNSGSMVDADSIGTAGDPACGDSLTLYIKVKENIIANIKIHITDNFFLLYFIFITPY